MNTKISNATKESLIADIKSRLDDGIIEKSNADLLIKLINNAKDLNEAINIAALGTTYRPTGFHFDKRLEKLTDDIKYFKKNEKLSFVDKKNKNAIHHKLIIGDNYDALQNLLIEYDKKIDVIYIDPPYGKDSMGEFAATNYDNAITRDNLLSMLYNRLVLAKQLLTDDGVIFCSIDDRNQAYVKCLFDEIFGEMNFIGVLHWKRKKQPSFLSVISSVMEYILIYAKDKKQIKLLSIDSIKDSNKPVVNSSNDISVKIIKKGIRVKKDISIIKKGTYKVRSVIYEYLDDIHIKNGITLNDFRCKSRFRATQDNIDDYCKKDLLFITSNLGLRRDLEVEEKDKDKAIVDLLLDWGQNQDGSNEVKKIFNIKDTENIFDNPKPTLLIKNIIKSTMKLDAIVLDFFAGTGTTGQSVLELNREDDGERQYILVQLNEDLDNLLKKAKNNKEKTTLKNQIKLCDILKRPHKLSEITVERLRRIMTGKSFDGKSNFEWIKKNEALGGALDVYDIETVASFQRTKGKTPFDLIDETLYGKEKFKKISDKIKWVCENLEHTRMSEK